MKASVPKESTEGERRVALVPDVVRTLAAKGVEICVQKDAGSGAHIADSGFESAGATIAEDSSQAFGGEVVIKIAPPTPAEIELLKPQSVLIGLLEPLTRPDTARALAEANVTSFAMEAIPRITRAQTMDALSSQSTIAGYKAALIAADRLPRFFPMLTTAAGTVPPAKVLVIGAGVAGLQALATVRRLGAVTSAYDTRSAVREQVESLGASFLDLDLETEGEGEGGYARELEADAHQREVQALGEAIADFDAVITTALVPGKPAPVLISADTVSKMKPGAVIVDLAAPAGGNCELTEASKTVEAAGGVSIIGPVNLPATMPDHASQLYARNASALLDLMIEEGQLKLDLDDEILAGACITHNGEIVHPSTKAVALPSS
jgi:H+-translocating NAD(P) transhydrogenase subunit alpha